MHSQGVSVVAKKKYTEEEARERKNARERERKAKLRAEGKMPMHDGGIRQVNINFPISLYSDVLDYLSTRKSKSAYLKGLIRDDLKTEMYRSVFDDGSNVARSETGVKSKRKVIGIMLNKDGDSDIIDILSLCANKPAYIAKLVRRDMFRKRVGILPDD